MSLFCWVFFSFHVVFWGHCTLSVASRIVAAWSVIGSHW